MSEKDSGQSEAINKGFKKATGEIITWINSDDMLTEGALTKGVDLFNNNSDKVGLIHGNTILFDDKKTRKLSSGFPSPAIERYISGIAFAQPSSFIRKKYWDAVGELNTDYHYGMDYDLFAKLALISEFKKVDETLSLYRLHDESKGISQNKLFIDDWIEIYNNILFNFGKKEQLEINKKLNISSASSEFSKFTFEYNEPLIDWELCNYYFLTDVLSADYRNKNFKRAKEILKHLNKKYKKYLNTSKEIKKIAYRLRLVPVSIIKGYRSLTNE